MRADLKPDGSKTLEEKLTLYDLRDRFDDEVDKNMLNYLDEDRTEN